MTLVSPTYFFSIIINNSTNWKNNTACHSWYIFFDCSWGAMSNWKRENKSLGSQPSGYFWNLVGRQWLLNWGNSNREVNKGRKQKKLRRFKSCLNMDGEGGGFIGSLSWLAVTLTEMENWRAIIVIGMRVDKE